MLRIRVEEVENGYIISEGYSDPGLAHGKQHVAADTSSLMEIIGELADKEKASESS